MTSSDVIDLTLDDDDEELLAQLNNESEELKRKRIKIEGENEEERAKKRQKTTQPEEATEMEKLVQDMKNNPLSYGVKPTPRPSKLLTTQESIEIQQSKTQSKSAEADEIVPDSPGAAESPPESVEQPPVAENSPPQPLQEPMDTTEDQTLSMDDSVTKEYLKKFPKLITVLYQDKYYKLPFESVSNKLHFCKLEVCTKNCTDVCKLIHLESDKMEEFVNTLKENQGLKITHSQNSTLVTKQYTLFKKAQLTKKELKPTESILTPPAPTQLPSPEPRASPIRERSVTPERQSEPSKPAQREGSVTPTRERHGSVTPTRDGSVTPERVHVHNDGDSEDFGEAFRNRSSNPPQPPKRLYVGNIPQTCNSYEVRGALQAFGPVQDFFRVGENRFGFVTFENGNDADACMDATVEVNGTILIINLAMSRNSNNHDRSSASRDSMERPQSHRNERESSWDSHSSEVFTNEPMVEAPVLYRPTNNIVGETFPLSSAIVSFKKEIYFKMIIHGKPSVCDDLNLHEYDDLEFKTEMAPVVSHNQKTDVADKCRMKKKRSLTLIKEQQVVHQQRGQFRKCKSRWTEFKRKSESENSGIYFDTDDFELFLWSPNAKFIKEELRIVPQDTGDNMIGIFCQK